jgi:hypothetical protein
MDVLYSNKNRSTWRMFFQAPVPQIFAANDFEEGSK